MAMFPTTHWSLLANASLDGNTESRKALEELCRRYWGALNQFIRSRGYSKAEAEDLTPCASPLTLLPRPWRVGAARYGGGKAAEDCRSPRRWRAVHGPFASP